MSHQAGKKEKKLSTDFADSHRFKGEEKKDQPPRLQGTKKSKNANSL
ncbi:MAG: hypothetical protein V1792_14905 [Pseudomonadota bacterium]